MVFGQEFLLLSKGTNLPGKNCSNNSPNNKEDYDDEAEFVNPLVPWASEEFIKLTLFLIISILVLISFKFPLSVNWIWLLQLIVIGFLCIAWTKTATLVLCKMVFIKNDGWREHHHNKEVICGDDRRSVNSERLDWHHWTHDICEESNCCCAWRDCNGSDCTFPRITHSLLLVALINLYECTLPPCVDEHKDVISCNTEHNKDYQVV